MRFLLSLLLLVSLSLPAWASDPSEDESTPSRPNIVLLVADDLGYADLGSYGGDIRTPHLDQLAREGIRFSRFHTAPVCAPTRAMLLAGTDNHVAGLGSQFRNSEEWGYEGHLTDRVRTIPQVLGTAGYRTYMVGKWHLGTQSGELPADHGFDHSFALHQGMSNHYNDTNLLARDSISDYSSDGKPVDWPEDAYSTDLYTDSLIAFIESGHGNDTPFFAYAAYTSPHWPLQVDESFWKKYESRYAAGYHQLRAKRLATLREAGMIAEEARLPPLSEEVRPWDSLTTREKKRETRKMALYAGMVENLDYHIGRLIRHLKEMGEYENTLIVFMSDNGAAGEDFYNNPDPIFDFIRSQYDNRYENMGTASSFISYGPPWAEAGSAPFRYFKGSTYEGGIVAPMIVRGAAVKPQGRIYEEFVTLTDLAPTFYEIANATYPASGEDTTLYPLQGTSLRPVFNGSTDPVHPADEAWVLEHDGRVLVRQGSWTLVNQGLRWDRARFRLYNLARDPTQRTDLSDERPTVFEDLYGRWMRYRNRYHLQAPDPTE